VFVSHRQVDRDWALRVAFLAVNEGFDFWLDVLDPNLQALERQRWRGLTAQQKAVAIALIIEMALLNSTHIIALVTPNSRGSLWIPYEYGRAKEVPPLSLQAGCWKHPKTPDNDFPEYLHLGVTTCTEDEIRNWLRHQRSLWRARYTRGVDGTSDDWDNTIPSPLPR